MSTTRTLSVPRTIRLAASCGIFGSPLKPRKQAAPTAPPATPIDPVIRGSIYFRRAVQDAMKYLTRSQAEEQVAASIQAGATRSGADIEDVLDELDKNGIDLPAGMPTTGRVMPTVQQLASKLNVTADEADRQVQALARYKKISQAEAASMLLSPDAGKRFGEPRVTTSAADGDFVTEARKMAADKKIRIDQAMSQIARERPDLYKTFLAGCKR